ncbi:SMAP domain containing protein [Trichuris trichiura]|uniref:SMAP domain containing protein n=1 Tax=Trichuris trichiura TaxID=36087 RepID=A0A077Z5T7_TRITR|nr:SMAP domain containing protein [Trichuris trichiura]
MAAFAILAENMPHASIKGRIRFPLSIQLSSVMESIGEYTLTSDEEKDIADKAELAKDQMTTEKNHSELEAADNSDSLGANEVGPAEGQSALASNTCTTSEEKPGRYRRTFGDRVDGHRSERATVNADDLMQQVQERKRLWQSNKAEKKISSQWQQLISSCDNRQTANKFCKLMGIKGDAIIDNDPTCAEKQECDRNSRVMENLDRQYAEARILTHTCRGMGLGYGSGH